MNSLSVYIRESLEELRLVRWPTQQQAIRLTLIVVGFIAVSAAFFGLIDAGLFELIRMTMRA